MYFKLNIVPLVLNEIIFSCLIINEIYKKCLDGPTNWYLPIFDKRLLIKLRKSTVYNVSLIIKCIY